MTSQYNNYHQNVLHSNEEAGEKNRKNLGNLHMLKLP